MRLYKHGILQNTSTKVKIDTHFLKRATGFMDKKTQTEKLHSKKLINRANGSIKLLRIDLFVTSHRKMTIYMFI